MKRKLLFFWIFCIFVTLSSCDDGRIYKEEIVIPTEGLTLKLSGDFSGIASWPEKYSLVIAGFSGDSEYATISKVISNSGNADGQIDVSMSGIKDEVTSLELCVINRLRKRVITYKAIEKEDFAATNDTIYMEVGKLDVGMFTAIQENVFTPSCASCHGSNGFAAKNLFLTEGQSYSELVNTPSTTNAEYLRVNPGNASESFLHLVLNEEGHVAHSHLDILDAKKSSVLLTLIDDWINNGANE